MFFGSFSHSLDDKGRLVIPRKMRDELGNKAYITKGFDGALAIYKSDAFEKLMKEANNLPFNKKDPRAYLRIQLAQMSELEIDKMGRVQLPATLLNRYHIGKEVIVLGVSDHIEVWDAKAFDEYISSIDNQFEQIAENLESDKE